MKRNRISEREANSTRVVSSRRKPRPLLAGPSRALVLLIGQARNRSARSRPERVLEHPHLALRCGVALPEFLGLFARANLVDRWPGPSPQRRGDVFPVREARERAPLVLAEAARLPLRLIVALGRGPARVLGLPDDWFRPGVLELPGCPRPVPAVAAPHPSLVSLWWNEPENRAAAEIFWARATRVARGLACGSCGGLLAGVVDGGSWCVACGRREADR